MKNCPKCKYEGLNFAMEKSPDGNTICMMCQYKAPHSAFIGAITITEMSFDLAWSKSIRPIHEVQHKATLTLKENLKKELGF